MRFFIGTLVFVILSSFTIGSFYATSLRIKIHNELGNIEDSVEVTLYTSITDYRNEKNQAFHTKYTDSKGRVTFKKVEPIVYYIHAKKGNKDNVGKGVVSDTIITGQLNKLTIIIE